jgi:hypothetical protein
MRNEARDATTRVPDEVFQRMVATLEAPDSSKNFYESNTLILDSIPTEEKMLLQHIQILWTQAQEILVERIQKKQELAQTLAQREKDRQHLCNNRMHELDLELRKCIKEFLSCCQQRHLEKNQKACQSRRIVQAKKEFLKKIKLELLDDQSERSHRKIQNTQEAMKQFVSSRIVEFKELLNTFDSVE